ncbi:MAG: alpha/beta hydrolase [Prevotellaceae bacterium]|nr:alpha/beta hydrolase [Prevotellaceae bacterium]
MKKTVVLLMGFMAVATCFAACSSDDNEVTTPPESIENEETADSILAGTELVVDSAEVWSERDGNKIFGMMYYNSASSKKQPAVILSHSSSLTHKAMSGYAKEIAKMGYAAYCFDFCGGSSKSKSDGKTDEMTVFTEVEDLRAVAKTVKAQQYVDPSRVVLLGSSQGGLVSALLADECRDDFAGMILFYPAFNIPELVKMFSSFGNLGDFGNFGDFGNLGDFGNFGDFGGMTSMGEAFVSSIKDFDVWSHIGKFDKPVSIIHGTQDIIVPISNSEKAALLYPSATLNKIEGANHGFNAANLGSMGSIMGSSADYDSVVMPIVEDFLVRF